MWDILVVSPFNSFVLKTFIGKKVAYLRSNIMYQEILTSVIIIPESTRYLKPTHLYISAGTEWRTYIQQPSAMMLCVQKWESRKTPTLSQCSIKKKKTQSCKFNTCMISLPPQSPSKEISFMFERLCKLHRNL